MPQNGTDAPDAPLDKQGILTPVGILCGVLLSVIMLLTLADNVFMWVAILRTKRLRTESNVLLLCLSLTDILMAVTSMPASAYNFFMGRNDIPRIYCSFFAKMFHLCVCATILTLTAITVDRYIRVSLHDRHAKICGKPGIVLCIAGIWLLSAVYVVPFAHGWYHDDRHIRLLICAGFCTAGPGICTLKFFTSSGVPFIVIVVCYWKIFNKFKETRRHIEKAASQYAVASSSDINVLNVGCRHQQSKQGENGCLRPLSSVGKKWSSFKSRENRNDTQESASSAESPPSERSDGSDSSERASFTMPETGMSKREGSPGSPTVSSTQPSAEKILEVKPFNPTPAFTQGRTGQTREDNPFSPAAPTAQHSSPHVLSPTSSFTPKSEGGTGAECMDGALETPVPETLEPSSVRCRTACKISERRLITPWESDTEDEEEEDTHTADSQTIKRELLGPAACVLAPCIATESDCTYSFLGSKMSRFLLSVPLAGKSRLTKVYPHAPPKSIRWLDEAVQRAWQEDELKVVKSIGLIILAYVVSYLPLLIISLVMQTGKTFQVEGALFLVVLLYANSFYNPLIYGARDNKIKAAYRKLWADLKKIYCKCSTRSSTTKGEKSPTVAREKQNA